MFSIIWTYKFLWASIRSNYLSFCFFWCILNIIYQPKTEWTGIFQFELILHRSIFKQRHQLDSFLSEIFINILLSNTMFWTFGTLKYSIYGRVIPGITQIQIKTNSNRQYYWFKFIYKIGKCAVHWFIFQSS